MQGLNSRRQNSLIFPHKHLNTTANSEGMQFRKRRPLLATASNKHHGTFLSINASKETRSAHTKTLTKTANGKRNIGACTKTPTKTKTAKETQLRISHETKPEYKITHDAAMLREQ